MYHNLHFQQLQHQAGYVSVAYRRDSSEHIFSTT